MDIKSCVWLLIKLQTNFRQIGEQNLVNPEFIKLMLLIKQQKNSCLI